MRATQPCLKQPSAFSPVAFPFPQTWAYFHRQEANKGESAFPPAFPTQQHPNAHHREWNHLPSCSASSSECALFIMPVVPSALWTAESLVLFSQAMSG